jgi:hypothetical protein
VAVRVGKRKKAQLMVEVFDATGGAEVEAFVSPFQKPACTRIQVSVTAGGQVVVSARKGKRTVTATYTA